ncbi:hypothetical protein PINS_up003025 [Pythium insidiosum]|nr:hypothetical protein PINS_up003025 [Pythium insidiosum]
MDALSRLMTAATSAARLRRRAQKTITDLFGRPTPLKDAMQDDDLSSCSACASSTSKRLQALVPSSSLQRCAHCERQTGACCRRECVECGDVFCPNCSTVNCDEQFDRVFCLSCHFDVSR